MRRIAIIFLLLCLAGCGGGGGGGSVPSPFAGAWTGSMVIADGSGGATTPATVQMTVGSDGRIAGTWEDPAYSGTLSGSVSPQGRVNLGVGTPGPPPVTMPCEGDTALSTGGAWQGTLAVTDSAGAGMSVTLDVVRQ